MSERLKELIAEFYEEHDRVTNERVIQARELQSIQKAIRVVSEKEILIDEEQKQVNNIINIKNEWWCKFDGRGRLF